MKRVLVFQAHPDDMEIGCGGTLIKFADRGYIITLVIITNGEKGSPDEKGNLKKLIAARKRETKAAARFMGIREVVHLDNPDGEIESNSRERGRIVELIRKHRPDIVFAPDPTSVFFGNYINHIDHRTAGWLTVDSILPAGNWHFYKSQFKKGLRPHNVKELYLSVSNEPNWTEDISKTFKRKIQALAFHKSQLRPFPSILKSFEKMLGDWAKKAGKKHKIKYAEEFKRLVFNE